MSIRNDFPLFYYTFYLTKDENDVEHSTRVWVDIVLDMFDTYGLNGTDMLGED